MEKSKCGHIHLDGCIIHINGDVSKMDDKTLEAINKMVKIAKNYEWMSNKLTQFQPRKNKE